MSETQDIPVLNHELAEDELAWVKAVHEDFRALRDASGDNGERFDPKEALRGVLAKPEHQLPGPMDLSGPGPWRNGRNRHGRYAAAVFLPKVELHAHAKSRTDQFPMYVVGEADAFSLDEQGLPVLTPVVGGGHFHNAPGAPHAFLPKVSKEIPGNWEIVFIAITPRNLREDTQPVSDTVRRAYEQVTNREAPHGV